MREILSCESKYTEKNVLFIQRIGLAELQLRLKSHFVMHNYIHVHGKFATKLSHGLPKPQLISLIFMSNPIVDHSIPNLMHNVVV